MAWDEHAVCRNIGGELWFPEHGQDSRPAQRICRERCPVVMECLEYALARHERNGIWGGMTYKQRLKYQKQRAA